MHETNNQTSSSGVSSKSIAPDGQMAAPDMPLSRPIGVTVIAALNFILGSVIMIYALPRILRLLTYRRDLDEFNMGNTVFIEGWLSVGGLLLAALFFLAAVGLWMHQKWGLRLAFITSTLVLLSGLSSVCAVATGGSLLSAEGLIIGLAVLLVALVGPFMLFFLSKREVRAQFR